MPDEIDRQLLDKLEIIIKKYQDVAPDLSGIEVRPTKKLISNAKSKLREAMNLASDLAVELSNILPKD